MRVYVYETTGGLVADFRPYLDGHDHAFEPARPLGGGDARWEKIQNTNCPHTGRPLWGDAKFVGFGQIDDYHELMIFPMPYAGEVEREGEEAEGAGAGDGASAETSEG